MNMLCRLAMELLRRQPATFADIVNGEIVGVVASQPQSPSQERGLEESQEPQPQEPQDQGNLAMKHVIGAIVVSAEICQHRKKTNAVAQLKCLVSQYNHCFPNSFWTEMSWT